MIGLMEPERLDVRLAADRGITRHAAQTLIAAGRVMVNGRKGRPGQRVRDGDDIAVDETRPVAVAAAADAEEPAVGLAVVYEDADIAVVDKPAGLVVHPAPGHPHGTLADGLRQRGATWSLLGGAERPGIVHRLDRDTSGLLVAAKTEAAHRHLAAQLGSRALGRTYWALVRGRFSESTGRIDAPIGRDPRDRKRMAIVDSGREAITDFRVVARHPRATELDVDLLSGRTHQIRVHLASIGHQVVGDPVYGRARPEPGIRLALHARRLRLVHPRTGEEMTFESPLPPELEEMRSAAGEGRL